MGNKRVDEYPSASLSVQKSAAASVPPASTTIFSAGKQHFPLLIHQVPVHGERLAIPLIGHGPQRTETELRDGGYGLTGDGGHLLIKFTLCHLGILATGQETETGWASRARAKVKIGISVQARP